MYNAVLKIKKKITLHMLHVSDYERLMRFYVHAYYLSYIINNNIYCNICVICFRFEDGTLPFLEIIALKHGFDALHRIAGGLLVYITYMYRHMYYLLKVN